MNTGRYKADSLYVLAPAGLGSAALHMDSETDLLARIDGFYVVAPVGNAAVNVVISTRR